MENTPNPQQQIMQLVTAKLASQALTMAAEFGLADHLKDGPRTAAQLASASGCNEDAIYRLLRAVSAVGVFAEQPGRTFANNANSETLRSDVPGSLRAMVRWIGDESSWWKAWGHMSHSLRTGQPATEVAFGSTAFEFFGRNPKSNEVFQGAMTSFSGITAQAVVNAYSFAGVQRIVDVGGGHGLLLSTILASQPQAKGVLCDLPEVVAGADATLKQHGQAARVEKVPGNFFEGVPGDADAYIMKHIIHDWDDARCTKLLQNCRAGLRPGGRVLIVEQVLSDRPESVLAKMLDLEMLVMTPGGRERSEADFAALLKGAGLKLTRIVPTQSPVCVIEAHVA